MPPGVLRPFKTRHASLVSVRLVRQPHEDPRLPRTAQDVIIAATCTMPQRTVVVLPELDSPTRPSHSPSPRSRFAPRTTCNCRPSGSPYQTLRLRTSRRVILSSGTALLVHQHLLRGASCGCRGSQLLA